jgi:hypothetical protein
LDCTKIDPDLGLEHLLDIDFGDDAVALAFEGADRALRGLIETGQQRLAEIAGHAISIPSDHLFCGGALSFGYPDWCRHNLSLLSGHRHHIDAS